MEEKARCASAGRWLAKEVSWGDDCVRVFLVGGKGGGGGGEVVMTGDHVHMGLQFPIAQMVPPTLSPIVLGAC